MGASDHTRCSELTCTREKSTPLSEVLVLQPAFPDTYLFREGASAKNGGRNSGFKLEFSRSAARVGEPLHFLHTSEVSDAWLSIVCADSSMNIFPFSKHGTYIGGHLYNGGGPIAYFPG